MNKEKALTIIENVCAAYKGTLQDHQNIQSALQVIKEALEPKEVKVPKKKP